MVLKDLASIGIDPADAVASKPLHETEAFVAYMYRVASERDATARLGYSFWAEGSYESIEDLVATAERDLGLEDRQMMFFREHSTIDVAHFDQVKKVIAQFCEHPAAQEEVSEVLRTSLYLTGHIADGMARRHLARRAA